MYGSKGLQRVEHAGEVLPGEPLWRLPEPPGSVFYRTLLAHGLASEEANLLAQRLNDELANTLVFPNTNRFCELPQVLMVDRGKRLLLLHPSSFVLAAVVFGNAVGALLSVFIQDSGHILHVGICLSSVFVGMGYWSWVNGKRAGA